MRSRSWPAWSCTVRIVVADDARLDDAAGDLTALMNRVERAASRFLPHSALSRANASAGRPTPIPPLLRELVGVALDAAAVTDGAVDPTLGRTLSGLGYDRDINAIADSPAVVTTSAPTRDWHAVRLYRDAGLLTVPAGTALDLGATAKAYTADVAAREINRRYGTAVLVEIGGDLAVAGRGEWPVQITEREGGAGQIVILHDGGIATSSTAVRRWSRGGRQLHHIIDPRTGEPAAGPWRTVTVAAQSALAANTASTAAIVKGERAVDWLTDHRFAARLVDHEGRLTTTTGWPEDTRERADAMSGAAR